MLGSGLGDFAHSLGEAVTLPYTELPHWPASRVIGHAGRWSSAGRTAGRSRRWPAAAICTKGMTPARDLRRPRAGPARREDADPHQRRRRREHRLRAGRADGDRRPHQPDRAQSAGRRQRRSIRRPVSGHDRGLLVAVARHRRSRRRGRSACRCRTAFTRRCWDPATKRPRRSGICGRSAPTQSACPRCPKRSSPARWRWTCWVSRASPTWPPVCCRSRWIMPR